jgi:hypothetical protein
MSAAIIKFPSRTVRNSHGSHRTRGVCVHCLGWYRELTDFSCYGIGKWCDGCEPVLREVVEKILATSRSAGPVRSAVDEAGSPR